MSKVSLRVIRNKRKTENVKRKTHSGFKKRVKINKNGNISMPHSARRHNMSQKTKDMLRQTKGNESVNPSLVKLIRNAMVAKIKRVVKKSTSYKSLGRTIILPKKVSKLLLG